MKKPLLTTGILLTCSVLSLQATATETGYPPPPGSYRGEAGLQRAPTVPTDSTMRPTGTLELPSEPGWRSGAPPLPETFPGSKAHRYGADNLFGSAVPPEPVSTVPESPMPSPVQPESPEFIPTTRDYPAYPQQAGAYPPYQESWHAPPDPGYQGYYVAPDDPAYPHTPPVTQPQTYHAVAPPGMPGRATGPFLPYGTPQGMQVQPYLPQQAIPSTDQIPDTGSPGASTLFRPAD